MKKYYIFKQSYQYLYLSKLFQNKNFPIETTFEISNVTFLEKKFLNINILRKLIFDKKLSIETTLFSYNFFINYKIYTVILYRVKATSRRYKILSKDIG